MAAGWILHALFASLIGQAVLPTNQSPIPESTTTSSVYQPVVHTVYGYFRGIQKKTDSNVLVDVFLGIPYASPPVGQLRFQKPHPPLKSRGIRDASRFANECYQLGFPDYIPPKVGNTALPRDEDCLYLNIYKPVTGLNNTLPVMVWVHGGGYVVGAGSQYEGSDLARKGVIVVTINYRLDVFGFLSNEDDVIPGNYGMLDQVMALKWVKENIQSFGGDPDRVTIFGESSGSSSVSLLVLSPLCKGLFNRAIMESGTSLSPWALNHPATRVTPRQIAFLLSSAVGCMNQDATQKLECLQRVDAEKLMNASVRITSALNFEVFVKPVVERTYGFLPDLPIKMWTQNNFNHVDTIRGFNKAENGELFGSNPDNITAQDFVKLLDNTILSAYALLDKDELLQEMLTKYVGNETDSQQILLDLIHASSDFEYNGPTLIEANIESKLALEKKHYVYQFDHKSGLSLTPSWIPAAHGEEVPFVFGVNLAEFNRDGKNLTASDKSVSSQMQTLWTNFAKNGDPTKTMPNGAVTWEMYDSDKAKVIRIKSSSQILSFKDDIAAYFFPKIIRKLDTSLTDGAIIG